MKKIRNWVLNQGLNIFKFITKIFEPLGTLLTLFIGVFSSQGAKKTAKVWENLHLKINELYRWLNSLK